MLISGQASGEEGSRTYALTFSQTGTSVDSVDDESGLCSDELAGLGSFIAGAFGSADVPAEDGESPYMGGDGFTGTVTLTAAG